MSVIIKIEGTAIDENKLAERSVNIKRTFEKGRSLSLALYYTAAEGIPAEGQDIEVFEDTTRLFGGIIKTVKPIPITPDQSTSADLRVQISSDGYNDIPQRRTINTAYTSTTAGAIVTEMVTSFLSAEGVTAGTIETGATIDTYNGVYQSIKEVLDDMAEASGFTWNINDAKELNFEDQTVPVISTKTLTSDDGDHFNFRPTRTLKDFCNKQYVEGGTDDTGATVRVVVEDPASIAARAAAEGNSGVYGNVYRDTTIQTVTDATTVANDRLKRKVLPAAATFSSYALSTEYDEGEVIEVTYAKYSIAAGSDYLVTTKTLKREKHRWVYTYAIQARDTSDYSGKTRGGAIEFFSRLARGTLQTAANTVASVIQLFVQALEPTGAPEKSVWIKTDDYSRYDILSLTAAETLTVEGEESIEADGTFTITLFTAAGNEGVIRRIKNIGTGTITIDGNGTETIDGATTYTMSNQYDFVEIESDGTNWKIASGGGAGGSPSQDDPYWEPITNGDSTTPEVVFFDGDIVMGWIE